MKLFESINVTKNDALLNQNEGMVSYSLHRLTGLALAGYIFLHITVLSSILISTGSFDDTLRLVQGGQFQSYFKWLEMGLVGIIFIHMFNGLRITIADFAKATRLQKPLLWAALAAFIAFMAYTFLVFLKS